MRTLFMCVISWINCRSRCLTLDYRSYLLTVNKTSEPERNKARFKLLFFDLYIGSDALVDKYHDDSVA